MARSVSPSSNVRFAPLAKTVQNWPCLGSQRVAHAVEPFNSVRLAEVKAFRTETRVGELPVPLFRDRDIPRSAGPCCDIELFTVQAIIRLVSGVIAIIVLQICPAALV
jgi:hypothetical protein